MTLSDLSFRYIFQIYGVVATKSKISVLWTFALLLLMICHYWYSYEFRVFKKRNKTIEERTHVIAHILLHGTRIFVMVSSILNMNKFDKIFAKFQFVDAQIQKMLKSRNFCWRFEKTLMKMLLIVVFELCLVIYNVLVNKVNIGEPMHWFNSFHIIHVKSLSFVYFVDMLNFRLDLLRIISKHDKGFEVLKLHTQLFLISKVINSVHKNVLLFITIQHCVALILNSFWFFVNLSCVDVFAISRESNFYINKVNIH